MNKEDAAQFKSIGDVVHGSLKRLDEKDSSITTGFAIMDRYSKLQRGVLTTIGATTGTGKTAVATSMSLNQARLGVRVLFFTLEMTFDRIGYRLLSHQSGVNLRRMVNHELRDDDYPRLVQAAGALQDYPIELNEDALELPVLEKAIASKVVKDEQVVVYVDFAGHVELRGLEGEGYERVSAIAKRLAKGAKVLNIPIVMLTQLNRNPDNRKDHVPELGDISDSSKLAHYSNTVMLLHRPGQYDDAVVDDIMRIYVRKNRDGPKGYFDLNWNGPNAQITEPIDL